MHFNIDFINIGLLGIDGYQPFAESTFAIYFLLVFFIDVIVIVLIALVDTHCVPFPKLMLVFQINHF